MTIASSYKCSDSKSTSVSTIKTLNCNGCLQHKNCLSGELNDDELLEFNSIAKHSKKLQRGEFLYKSGDKFDAIYIIRSGSLKNTLIDEEGREQILNFSIQGDVIGLEGLYKQKHITESKALETTFLCSISLAQYLNLASQTPKLYRRLLNHMSSRIIEEEEHSLMLGTKNTEQKLATFILRLIKRNSQHEFSDSEITLNISRKDIGNYLSAAVETISRIFTRFQDQGLIEVQGRHIRVVDMERLENIAK
ncbi:MAG: helix-turn-helix domain-containing protein [Gammaproteobacteria bacterium]|nr:helix-turn-helix domain-containing protein [Gammaproteobacteria bacterium]